MGEKDGQTLSWLWRVSGAQKWSILWLTAAQSLEGLGGVAAAWLLRGIINSAVAGNSNGFWHYAAVLVLLTLGRLGLRALIRFLAEFSKSGMENLFKRRLFSSLLYGDYVSVTATHSGEWLNRFSSDTAVVAEGMTSIIPEAAGLLAKLLGALALILYLIPRALWLLLPGGVALISLTYAFRKVLKKLHRHIQETDGALRVFVTERLSNQLIVRSFARENTSEREAEVWMERHRSARLRRNRFSNLCNIGFGLIMRGVYVASAMYCGYGILTGTMSYGNFTAILQLIGQIQSPFANLSGYLPKYAAMLASAERLKEAETFPQDRGDALSQEKVAVVYRSHFEELRFQNVTFSYRPQTAGGETFILKDLCLTLRKGDYLAITGPSGCGKSTVLKLMMCLYPADEGKRQIVLDGEVQPLSSAWRGLFAYVPQGSQLMSGTIRESVAFGDADRLADENGIWRVLRIADAEVFVRQLPDGLDSVLGERGTGLSEGQIQRLAIARALMSENPILLLDEATSALDEDTEARVLQNLRSMTDKTTVIVTHRTRTLSICTRQLIMAQDGARIRELNADEHRT